MKVFLFFVLFIHGAFHIPGFLKAYEIADFPSITQAVSRTLGVFWGIAFLLFATTSILLLLKSRLWFAFCIAGLMVSQYLIISSWTDAKFGTIANLVIFILGILVLSSSNYNQRALKERAAMLSEISGKRNSPLNAYQIAHLPLPVKRWLEQSGAVGSAVHPCTYVEQELLIKLKPDQNKWYTGKAQQIITTDPPAFHWSVLLRVNRLINVTGRDLFINGKATMDMKLLGVFPLLKVSSNKQISQAALQRFLAEIVWVPSTALIPHIQWEAVSEYSAMATITCGGITGVGTFYFDENWDFKKFEALRYKDTHEQAEKLPWIILSKKTDVVNSIRVPTETEVQWKLEDEPWTWLKIKIRELGSRESSMGNSIEQPSLTPLEIV